MNAIADTGADWFCTAVRAGGWSSLEMQTCGGPDARFVVGLMTMGMVFVLVALTGWRLLEGRA